MREPGTLTGTVCLLCDEPFDDPLEVVLPTNGGTRLAHQACLLRAVAGGINHQRGICSCCGGDQPPDPPGLSRRQAARLALTYFQMTPAPADAEIER